MVLNTSANQLNSETVDSRTILSHISATELYNYF